MPITKSAKKKARVDKRRARVNRPLKTRTKAAVKRAQDQLTRESVIAMYSVLDKAVKKKLMSKNKAGRIKARVVARSKKLGKERLFGEVKQS